MPRPEGIALQTGVRQIWSASRRVFAERDLRVLWACCGVLGLASSFVVPFVSLFCTQAVGMSVATFGGFMTASAGLNIALATALAHRSDTSHSRRSMLLLGSACGALGYLGYAFVREPWLLFVLAGCVLGIASVTFSQLFAYGRELLEHSQVPAHEAPLYMNALRMSFALAWTVGPALAAAALQRWSFSGLFATAASLYALLFGMVLCWVPQMPPRFAASRRAPCEGDEGAGGQVAPGLAERIDAARVEPAAPAGAAAARELWANPQVLRWFVAFVLIFAAQTISMSNMSLLVLTVLGGQASHVGVIFSLAPCFELPLMLYFGLLATRTDTAKLIRFALGLAVVYYLALSCVRTPAQIYPLQLLSAAIVSVTSGVAITFFQNKSPGRFGAATNLYANASRIGSTSGYLLFGSVASHFGHRGAYVACSALAVLAGALTCGDARRFGATAQS